MQFTRINDIAIHYRLVGAVAEKPVLVFINSLGTDFRIWDDLVPRLSDAFAVVLYDKRGHGLSDIGQVPYAIEDHATDLAGLLDRLQVKRAIICGLSVGGLIAQSLYQRRPDLVRALVLADTAHKIGTTEMWDARIAAIEAHGIEAVADAVLERWFTPAFRRPENVSFACYRNMLIRQPAPGYVGTCAAIRDADYTEAAGKISVPVLCVVGDQDGSTPPDLVRSTAGLIPGARFEVIRDAGHIPCVEQPEALAATLRDFFISLPGDNPMSKAR
ncbi:MULTISPECIES: 3-oxoadipate enol-lactonase [Sinorhizobium]|uniref:3-oxoadipate enol-lactonase n=2 Tax=Sinorhizobium TaxID=28105 RepID=A0A2S3YJI9_9HYPH|nr:MULTISPECIES: 3-oxoadipate enol-lactonase [Sinorhizobium]AUX79667.1 3-oxoadipate enol-lactonase 2 [Sinorhizobium fredii]PDT41310.1 3-oxoadipate enol-lactonase [Sinorhizobium sp. FG01]POH27515.1 3-oxoadipate enol-lactonase [Sinorhizobium americanum]